MARTPAQTVGLLLAIGGVVVAPMAGAIADQESRPSQGSDQPGQLLAVDALSPTDVWAVGATPDLSHATALTMHWDGETWRRVPVPHPMSRGALWSVTAISTDDVWAAGYSGDDVGGHPLVLHWDGEAWTRSPIDPVPSTIAVGISGDAPDDVWVVEGSAFGANGSRIEHWDGSTWSTVTNPNNAYLRSVTAVTPRDAWAVGFLNQGRKEPTVAQHWDGERWTVVSTVDPHLKFNVFWDVSALPSGQAWSVGHWGTSGPGKAPSRPRHKRTHPLAEQWDGSGFERVTTPSPKQDAEFRAVSAQATDDVWAVGERSDPFPESLIVHWDGTSWSRVRAPEPPGYSQLEGVSADAPTDAWAVGYSKETAKPFSAWVEHWDGAQWTRS